MTERFSDYFALQAKCESQSSSPMSWADAVALFKEIKNLTSLRLEFNNTRCETRCNLIQELLESRGIPHGSIMVDCPPDHPQNWQYHFGAYAVLDTGQKVIFDPMTRDEPVLKERWTDYWEKEHDGNHIIENGLGFIGRPQVMKMLQEIHDEVESLANAPIAAAA